MKRQEKITVYWDTEDEAYISECTNHPDVIGCGNTEQEAIEVFYELLEQNLKAREAGRYTTGKGRPRKHNVKLGCHIDKECKDIIIDLANKKGVNQGSIIEELVYDYIKGQSEMKDR